jgi:hypothetical protein
LPEAESDAGNFNAIGGSGTIGTGIAIGGGKGLLSIGGGGGLRAVPCAGTEGIAVSGCAAGAGSLASPVAEITVEFRTAFGAGNAVTGACGWGSGMAGLTGSGSS